MDRIKRSITNIAKRVFSVYHSVLLFRESGKPCRGINEYCRFALVSQKIQLADSSSFEDSAVYVPIYEKMLDDGDMVIFGYRKSDEKCVFRCCVQLHGNIISDGCMVKRIEEKEGYIHYVYCDPGARRHGVHTSAMGFICEMLNNYSLYSIVRENNTSSLKGFLRNGYVKEKKLVQYNVFGFRKLVKKEV